MISKYSIAILPFVNMSSDKENEYFSDGITEEILNALSKLDGLHVTARTSSFAFKNQMTDVREIGKKLNVALVLEGSIRKYGNLVRITAQLIKTQDGYHLWSETWERELKNVFTVQDEIASLISDKINQDLKPLSNIGSENIENTEALDYYLKGVYLQNKWDYALKEKVIDCFEEAIRLDPTFVQAYIGLSDVYTWLSSTGMVNPQDAYVKNEWCIQKVLELDKENPEIHRIISSKNFWIEWNFPLALKNINVAIEGKPSFPDALMQKGLVLAASGNIEEALDCMFQAIRLDPMSKMVNYTIGFIFHMMGEHQKALGFIDKNLELNPTWDAAYFTKFMALCKLNRFEEALEVMKKLSDNPQTMSYQYEAYFQAIKGNREEALELVSIMENNVQQEGNTQRPLDASFLSQIFLFLGDTEKALDYLNMGLEQRVSPLLFTRIDSTWDQVRDHPKFKMALEKLKISDDLFHESVKQKKYNKTSVSPEQAKTTLTKADAVMNEKGVYLEPTLTLGDLAELTGVSTNHLSQVLNEVAGKNFYDYVNSFRLQHFLNVYQSKEYKNFTILALAYECGFKSKSTFNTFFRKNMDMTPSEYVKNIK